MNNSQFFHANLQDLPAEVAHALVKGKVISVRTSAFPVPCLSVIQRYQGGNLYFRIPDELLKTNLFLGDTISCQVIDNEHEFVLTGIVGDVQYTYPREMQFCVKRIDIFKNARRFRRYNAQFPASLKSEKNPTKTYSIVRNISIADLNMVFKDNVDINTRVDVNVCVDKETSLKFKARIARVVPNDGYTECGMEIIDIDEINQDRLEKVIYQLQVDESRFINDSLK